MVSGDFDDFCATPAASRLRSPITTILNLGFANEYEEQLFRALAAVYPKGVAIREAGWRFYADEHVKLGTFSCAINGHAVYRLTREGVRRAVADRLMKDR